jgi:hypothetical protein
MTRRTTDRDDQIDDRILSDFSTEPELVGYTHRTWAMAVLFVGVMLFVLPQVVPLPVALLVGIGVLAGMGILFSAAPPHLSPWEFAYRRITSRTQQQIYVADRSGTARSNHTTDTEDDDNE